MGDKELDRIIEDALARYGEAEPLDGLEQRILNRAGRAGARRRTTLWLALAGAACVAAALLLVAVGLRSRPAPVAPKTVVAHVVTPQAATGRPQGLPHGERRVARCCRTHRLRPALPKLAEFPSPAPLSGGERALLAFVERHPGEARRVLFSPGTDTALEIPPLDIQPLNQEKEKE